MNLSEASEISIEGKIVDSILIDGRNVYTRSGVRLYLHCTPLYCTIGESILCTVNSSLDSGELINFYKVNGLTRTLLDTVETDSTGKANYTYTGTGAGSVSIVAVYDETDSNTVTIDDYTPAVTSVALVSGASNTVYGATVTLTATVKDQHGVALNGETVTFKRSTTTLGTAITNSSGVATYSYVVDAVGDLSLTATAGSVTSTAVGISVTKDTPVVTITPPTMVYSDNFSVSGTLKDSRGTGIVGETVTLHWKIGSGTEQTATTTSSTGGAFTFATMQTTSVSAYKFWITYAGDSNYNNASSSECEVTPSKETSVLNVNNPSSVVYGNNATVTGTLMDNDSPTATAITGALITITEGASTLGTGTTGNDGAFSVSISGLSVGTHSITVSYAGSDYYTQASDSSKSIVVTQGYSKIVASSDKSILSYADSEKATLYAQLKDSSDNDVALSGVTITFSDGTNTLGTASTDGTGLATLTNGYTSAGAGDISISATDGSLVSETYAIEDCKFYDVSSSSNISKYSTNNEVTHTFDSTENAYVFKIGVNNAFRNIDLNNVNVSRESTLRCKFKYKSGGGSGGIGNAQLGLGLVNSNTVIMGRIGIASTPADDIGKHTWNQFANWSQLASQTGVSFSTSEWYTLEVIFNNGSVTYKIYNASGTVISNISGTETVLSTSNRLTFSIGWTRNAEVYVKDIMIL